jgi:hypothetical protein
MRQPYNRSRRIAKKLLKRAHQCWPNIDVWVTPDLRFITAEQIMEYNLQPPL